MTTKILVIDDSATIRQQVRLALSQAGFDVLEAADGVEGLEQLRAGAGIDAVICDVNMPRMGGIDMLEQCSKQNLPAVPVLMLTTEGQPALIQKAKQFGAKGWIVKPFKPELLVAALKKVTQTA